MKEPDDSKPLTYFIQIDDASWGDKKHDGKRSWGATGKIPFIAAVETNELGHPIRIRFTRVRTFSKESVESWVAKHLTLDCHEHSAMVTGGGPDSIKKPEFKWVNTIAGI